MLLSSLGTPHSQAHPGAPYHALTALDPLPLLEKSRYYLVSVFSSCNQGLHLSGSQRNDLSARDSAFSLSNPQEMEQHGGMQRGGELRFDKFSIN